MHNKHHLATERVRPLLLYVALRHDYGDPRRGPSFEQMNFFETLRRIEEIDVAPFYFDEALRERGRRAMNAELLATAERLRPDLCFFALFTDEIFPDTIRALSSRGDTVTFNWFSDDHWRFRSFSRHWAPLFHWVVTTDADAVSRYHAIGYRNVIPSQWGCNHYIYKPMKQEKDIDVSFVGQRYGRRQAMIETLRRAGIRVVCWGRGWENGRLSQEEMVRLFSRSKINLNFTESSASFSIKPLAKVVFKRRADGSLALNSFREAAGSLATLVERARPQIKARNFEIPGSGGFLLTSPAEHLEEYYRPGEEIAVFHSADDLVEKVRYYLRHDGERESIRRAGFERTLREHTFELRFWRIFRAMGFELSVGREYGKR